MSPICLIEIGLPEKIKILIYLQGMPPTLKKNKKVENLKGHYANG